ncbi:hypothetical protein AAL_07025 [Moelleriella libera RCEF 2490]|uniref:Uncharacterized protein n=1 Tax=Moelleriella libera RCEF 2490 TaxID=1081109 RepID=A0A167Y2X8_9HYPO|nr:hypothetical protein AAL_07025 [Moelleriella libera RCEF 2490]
MESIHALLDDGLATSPGATLKHEPDQLVRPTPAPRQTKGKISGRTTKEKPRWAEPQVSAAQISYEF